ncbi:MAG: hypothetical protein C0407_04150 [Desulfobacca sp.]|nr:hypothetical protein [Desulfobacca sp.]
MGRFTKNPNKKGKNMADGINIKRTGKKLGLIFLGMIVFLLISMWIKGMEFKFRIFMALFAGLSAWMGIISLVIWLWKETKQDDLEQEKEPKESRP